MLDKTIPWHSFIMSLDPDDFSEQGELPKGYKIRPYSGEKDERAWAKIETAVGEFDSEEEAIMCHKHYLEYPEELKERQWFAVDENDDAVATCTVWWTGETKIPCIHALSCLPENQGKGLGKMVALRAIHSAFEKEKKTIWLETQTWSWKAICLYIKLGFVPRKKATFNETANDFEMSLPLICSKVGEEMAEKIRTLAVD